VSYPSKTVTEWEATMPAYHFALRSDAGHNEDLGFIDLRDDEDAVAFGRGVIDDLLQMPDPKLVGSTLDITERRRQVERLNLEQEIWRERKIV
jgi:hypothetical protein